MSFVSRTAWSLALVSVATAASLTAQSRASCPRTGTGSDADCAAVRRAALDYLEGFYEGDTVKLVRGIRPEVVKLGFWRARDSTGYAAEKMPWAEILSYAKGVKASGKSTPATAPKTVELLDVQDQTASAKVTAWWGTDYLLLGKYAGRWMIVQVLWQSYPGGTPVT